MSMRVVRPATAFSTTPRKRKDAGKSADYLDWVRQLPCVVTGRGGVQAAHLSTANPQYGHFGRAKARKAADRWALPLCPQEHARQHDGNELRYWLDVGINPYPLALSLYGVWSEFGDGPESFTAAAAIMARARN